MSQSIRDFNLLNRPADVTVTSADLVASGELVDLPDPDVTVWLDRDQTGDHNVQRLRYVTPGVWDCLNAFVHPAARGSRPGLDVIEGLLAFVVACAEDAAEGLEPSGFLLATPPLRGLNDKPVWLQRANEPDAPVGEWAAMFPEER
jgi:hypothetical protein